MARNSNRPIRNVDLISWLVFQVGNDNTRPGACFQTALNSIKLKIMFYILISALKL